MEVVTPYGKVKPFMSIKDASTATGLSQCYLRSGCKDGSVPHIMCGNQYRINLPLLLQTLNNLSRKEN